ncbi:hypothetical protein RSOL_207150 [Rhizoctonia solani AG-3 Rhs1AP]|uniref:Uncharacterized protein n=1 Tax=Rhizoctonia solani AG-3 Rhs1AP TaxID=1086054 RepID=X8J652_9AGAM|nr:hypothetical protein RSOL_207150 [Rhizoctonia solani AG-3 Rhs1AP]
MPSLTMRDGIKLQQSSNRITAGFRKC